MSEEGVPLYWQVRNREAMQAQRAAAGHQRPSGGERAAVAVNDRVADAGFPASAAAAPSVPAVPPATSEPVLVDDAYDSSTCIDLTGDTAPASVIDLTSPVANPDVVRGAPATSQAVRQRLGGRKQFHPNAHLVESDEEVEFVAATQPKRPRVESDPGSAKIECDAIAPVRQHPTSAAEVAPKIVGSLVSCPICLDEAQQIRNEGRQLCSTVCGHVFCDECIKNYVKTAKSCPTCRRKLTPKSIHPLFL